MNIQKQMQNRIKKEPETKNLNRTTDTGCFTETWASEQNKKKNHKQNQK